MTLEYPRKLSEAEDRIIDRPNNTGGPVGIAFSGGGIRSATLSLGEYQGLLDADLTDRIDIMSSVSGGGYLAGLIGRLYHSGCHPRNALRSGTSSYRYLRASGGYIAPGGGVDLWRWFVSVASNWLALMFTLLNVFLLTFLVLRWADTVTGPPTSWWENTAVMVMTIFMVALTGLTVARTVVRAPHDHWLGKAALDAQQFATSAAIITGVVAVVDTLGWAIAHHYSGFEAGIAAGSGTVMATIVAVGRRLSRTEKTGSIWKKVGVSVAMPIMTLTMMVLLLSSVSAATHLLAHKGGTFDTGSMLIATGIALLLFVAQGRNWWIVNGTSGNALFKSRIVRCFLGAGNLARQSRGVPMSEDNRGDDMPITQYSPHNTRGHLHIINTTLNETVDGRSKLHQTDRSGINLAVSPVGMSLGVRHHAIARNDSGYYGRVPIPNSGYHAWGNDLTDIFKPEELSLGDWLSISAAAASTGMGTRTSLFRSIMFTLLNIRLGYWWNANVGRGGPRLLPAYAAIFREMFTLFPGTAEDRWYLSDGGHFDNTALYELIRRRLPVIIACDHGRDPGYKFQDIGALAQRARADFGAEITFLSNEQLDTVLDESVRHVFGDLDDLERDRQPWDGALVAEVSDKTVVLAADDKRHSNAHAALARITYAQGETGILIYLKPTVTGDEPSGVRQYGDLNPDFPHQPTEDQMFDELQWESYRSLGQHIAAQVFAAPKAKTGKTPHEWVANGRGPFEDAIASTNPKAA